MSKRPKRAKPFEQTDNRELVVAGPRVQHEQPHAEPPPEEPAGPSLEDAVMASAVLELEHAPMSAAEKQRGRAADIDPAMVDRNWIIRQLVAEATDVGKRTRQSSRVAALKTLAEVIGATAPPPASAAQPDDPLADVDPWERKRALLERARAIVQAAETEQAAGTPPQS